MTTEMKHGFQMNDFMNSSPEDHDNLFCRSTALNEILEKHTVQCAIFSTFSLDFTLLQKEFPEFLGPNATIPTLMLHGDRSSIHVVDKKPKKDCAKKLKIVFKKWSAVAMGAMNSEDTDTDDDNHCARDPYRFCVDVPAEVVFIEEVTPQCTPTNVSKRCNVADC